MAYDVVLASINKKGRSELTTLQAFTLKNPEKQTDLSLAYSPAIEHMKPFLGTLLGIVGALFLIAVIIVIVVQMRGSQGRDRNNCANHARQLDTLTTTTTTSTTTSRNGQIFNEIGRDSCNESIDSIEKNPDVVPQSNKTDDRDEDETAFEWLSNAHPRIYATTVVAEQQKNVKNGQIFDKRSQGPPTFVVNDKLNLQQQTLPTNQFPSQIPTHQNYYSTLVPTSNLNYNKISPVN